MMHPGVRLEPDPMREGIPWVDGRTRPFYARHRMRWRSYGGLVRDWFIRNCAPHTNWEDSSQLSGQRSPASTRPLPPG